MISNDEEYIREEAFGRIVLDGDMMMALLVGVNSIMKGKQRKFCVLLHR